MKSSRFPLASAIIVAMMVVGTFTAAIFGVFDASAQIQNKHRYVQVGAKPALPSSISISDTTKPTTVGEDGSARLDVTKYSVTLSQLEWQRFMSIIVIVANQLRKSDLPSKDTNYMIDSLLYPTQREFANQINPQIQAAVVKYKADSTAADKAKELASNNGHPCNPAPIKP